jgi:DNA-binding LacI/PurR family transcriptional regulator
MAGPYNKRATIKDVAAAAGVSTQTVSRVINDRPDVASSTRKKVREAIERLGYRPSALARSMIRRRNYTLGVVTAGLKYIGPSRVLHGITDSAEEEGYGLLLKQLPSFGTTTVEPILDRLVERRVEGLIWAVPEVDDNHAWLQEHATGLGMPVVVTSTRQQPDTHVVNIDNYAGGQMATRHLIEQGYCHIGHISGPLEWWEAQERKAAWADVLAEAGLRVDNATQVTGNWSSASGRAAARQLFDQYPEMDAVFVANDQMALGVLQLAAERGIRIPQELGVVGFDDIPESAYFWPALTTVSQDQHRLGSSAVRVLIEMINARQKESAPAESGGHLDGKRLVLQPELIVRASSQ